MIKTTTKITTQVGKDFSSIRTRETTGPTYGKITEGSGIFKLSYEGTDPMRNYVYASVISVIRYTLIAGASAAVPIIVGWGLKKLNIVGRNSDDSHNQSATPNPTPKLNSMPMCRSFKEDVEAAIKSGEPQNLLCDEIHESSRLVIFSGPGIGKSIIADQMGFGIASGKPCGLFPNEAVTPPQQVLLIDTEQEDADLYIRYAEGVSHLPENMTRVSDCNFNAVEEVTDYVGSVVDTWTNNGTVIIDNITSAFSLQSPERVRNFYNQLKAIQKRMKSRGVIISYIIICHQTKSSTKLTLQAIQGTGNIGNFATAVYGLEKISEDLVKFKVLKNRRSKNNGRAYLEKFCEKPYFHFEFQKVVDCTEENELVEEINKSEKVQQTVSLKPSDGRKLSDEQLKEIRELYAQGASENSLARQFHVNRGTIRKYLRRQ